ncbi:hypothetical protein [Pseudarthrobacter sp. S9]|uniref:hypothetical protein n=1 Tax=Pseudarthrobacter sp. S9 TaxID=3418421 RepID=UPI003CFE96CC
MAISAVPYALQNGSHSADLFRQAVSSLVPPGGGLVTSGDLAVTQTGTASMNVVFGVGRAWVPGTNVGNVSGGNFSKQAMYFALNDAAYTASVATSDPVNPRIDVAYLAIQDSQYSGSLNAAVLGVATGVPTSGAAYPANAPTIPANAIALAWINVAANASSISNASITAIAGQAISPALGLVAQTLQTAGTSFTGATEQQVTSVSAYLVAGRSYRIRASVDLSANAANVYVAYRLKYGSTGGITGTNTRNFNAAYAISGTGQAYDINGQIFTAPSTGLSTCTMTAQIVVGTANTVSVGSSTPAPLSISVEDLG